MFDTRDILKLWDSGPVLLKHTCCCHQQPQVSPKKKNRTEISEIKIKAALTNISTVSCQVTMYNVKGVARDKPRESYHLSLEFLSAVGFVFFGEVGVSFPPNSLKTSFTVPAQHQTGDRQS